MTTIDHVSSFEATGSGSGSGFRWCGVAGAGLRSNVPAAATGAAGNHSPITRGPAVRVVGVRQVKCPKACRHATAMEDNSAAAEQA